MSRLAPWACFLSLLVYGCDAGEIDGAGGGGGGGGEIDAGGGGGGGPVEGEPAGLQGITSAHNQVRAAHGVVDIEWDDDLAAIAQAWADGCQWGHNDGRSDSYATYVGENIYGASFDPTGAQVTESWASEEANYNYENNSCNGVCGHYTQIVWAKSTKLGCAVANCPGGEVANFVVCDYAPGGNFNGEKPY